MTTFNLLFSLPHMIQSKIYEYDNTYRIFENKNFKEELSYKKLNNERSFKRCKQMITDYLSDLMYDGCCWHNEYGRIDTDDELSIKTPNYTSINDFCIELNYMNHVLYYKVLPKNLSIDKIQYTKYDGYFLDENLKNNLSEKVLGKLCRYHPDLIDSYDINDQIIYNEICLYFA